jgi:hypothetical protein
MWSWSLTLTLSLSLSNTSRRAWQLRRRSWVSLRAPAMLMFGLTWEDYDPTRITFDPERARAVVSSILGLALLDPKRKDLKPGWTRRQLEDALDQALVDTLGAWATGFRWAASEPGGGGPLKGYCCANHSLLRKEDAGPEDTTERLVGVVVEWHEFLVFLKKTFESLRAGSRDSSLERNVELAGARLLPIVLDRTHAEDAWYGTFWQLLVWYLESRGLDGRQVAPVIGELTNGRFQSWIAPDEVTAARTIEEIARAVAGAPEREEKDALAEWAKIRGSAFANVGGTSEVPVVWDAHTGFIEGRERQRDEQRARQMWLALQAARKCAASGETLTVAMILEWQELVLGRPPRIRETDAFAKQGRERYGWDPKAFPRFERWLAQATDGSEPVNVRAARAYLDVCFTHPFDDGNARAARLVLDFVLAREGLWLRAVEPLFVLSRAADDARGAFGLASMVGYLAGKTENVRWPGPPSRA